MAVPTVMTDLSVTAASNSPAGTDAIGTSLDDFLRIIQAIVRRQQAKGANIASASTVNIGAITDGNFIHITGTTTITAFDNVAAGISRVVVFDGALTFTHNATSLILPGGANITTAANDCALMVSEGSGNWRCVSYVPAAGFAKLSGNTFSGTQNLNNQDLDNIKTATFNSEATITDTTGTINIDWSAAQNYKQTKPTGTITYTMTDPPGPCHLQLRILSDGSSTAQTINWDSSSPQRVYWVGSTWAAATNKGAIINFWFDGTDYWAMGANTV